MRKGRRKPHQRRSSWRDPKFVPPSHCPNLDNTKSTIDNNQCHHFDDNDDDGGDDNTITMMIKNIIIRIKTKMQRFFLTIFSLATPCLGVGGGEHHKFGGSLLHNFYPAAAHTSITCGLRFNFTHAELFRLYTELFQLPHRE